MTPHINDVLTIAAMSLLKRRYFQFSVIVIIGDKVRKSTNIFTDHLRYFDRFAKVCPIGIAFRYLALWPPVVLQYK
jgi:hypothetical protein